MKQLCVLLCCLFVCAGTTRAQEHTTYIVKAGTTIQETIPLSEIYLYPQFRPGRVFYKDGIVSSGLLNYHRLLDEMHFVGPKGDTLAVANAPTIRLLTIGTDSFYYESGFVHLLSSTPTVKLAEKQYLKIVDREKIGGYGQATTSSAITNYTSFDDGKQFHRLTVKENLVITKEVQYYVGDRYDHFVPATRKSVLDLFRKNSDAVKRYLKDHNTSFKSREDLQALFRFLGQTPEGKEERD